MGDHGNEEVDSIDDVKEIRKSSLFSSEFIIPSVSIGTSSEEETLLIGDTTASEEDDDNAFKEEEVPGELIDDILAYWREGKCNDSIEDGNTPIWHLIIKGRGESSITFLTSLWLLYNTLWPIDYSIFFLIPFILITTGSLFNNSTRLPGPVIVISSSIRAK